MAFLGPPARTPVLRLPTFVSPSRLCLYISLSPSLSVSLSPWKSPLLRSPPPCVSARVSRANPCELLAVANYEVRLITTYAESKVFWTRWRVRGRTLEGMDRRLALWTSKRRQNYSKRIGLLLSGCSAIHAYNKPGLSKRARLCGFRLTRSFNNVVTRPERWRSRWSRVSARIQVAIGTITRNTRERRAARSALLSHFNLTRA